MTLRILNIITKWHHSIKRRILKNLISRFPYKTKAIPQLHSTPSTNLSSKGDIRGRSLSLPSHAIDTCVCVVGYHTFKSSNSCSSLVETKAILHIISTMYLKKGKLYLFSLNKSKFYVFTFTYFTDLHIYCSSSLHSLHVTPQVFYCQTSNRTHFFFF